MNVSITKTDSQGRTMSSIPIVSSPLLKAIFMAAIFAAIFPQEADARPSTQAFTCEGVRDYIASRGAAVMNTKTSSIYRRFVAHVGYCQSGEGIEYYSAPTRSGKCKLKICRDIDYDDFFRRRR